MQIFINRWWVNIYRPVISGANTLPIPEYRHQLKNINFLQI